MRCENPVINDPSLTTSRNLINVKPGQCPNVFGMVGNCANTCNQDSDCLGNQKCVWN